MKTISRFRLVSIVLLTLFALKAMAQQPAIQYFRHYDKRGINVFEPTKEDSVVYDGFKLRFGAGFTQNFQSLKHSTKGESTPGTVIPLYAMRSGFQLAQANFNIDAQLADGVSLNLISYMASHHHNEFWVKGGYLKVEKVTFLNSEFMNKLWKNLTLKVGHMVTLIIAEAMVVTHSGTHGLTITSWTSLLLKLVASCTGRTRASL